MKRWLLVLLCIVLPLQQAWASAVGLCGEHEAPAALHCLEHGDAELDAAEPALPGLDPGCEHCQAHGAPLIPMLVLALDTERADETVDAAPPHTPTPPRARPERPNWPTLA